MYYSSICTLTCNLIHKKSLNCTLYSVQRTAVQIYLKTGTPCSKDLCLGSGSRLAGSQRIQIRIRSILNTGKKTRISSPLLSFCINTILVGNVFIGLAAAEDNPGIDKDQTGERNVAFEQDMVAEQTKVVTDKDLIRLQQG